MAVEAQARLEAERVARAKPDRLHLAVAEQALGDRAHAVGLHRNLVTVLAGVARAADVTVDAVEARAARGHERHRGGAGAMTFQHGGGLRPLQRDQRAMIGTDEPHPRGQPGGDMGEVGVLARRVDDQHQHAVLIGLGGARDHQVVEDAAVSVGKLGVALPPGREVDDVRRHQGFHRAGGGRVVGADHEGLAHVRDVEQAGRLAGVGVLGDDAVGVLHRHFVAGEGHHAGAARDMERVERRVGERWCCSRGFAHRRFRIDALRANRPVEPPLSRNLRDFAAGYRWSMIFSENRYPLFGIML